MFEWVSEIQKLVISVLGIASFGLDNCFQLFSDTSGPILSHIFAILFQIFHTSSISAKLYFGVLPEMMDEIVVLRL